MPREVAVVGAGPYGLAVTAHLRARGVPVRIFGEPMACWRKMPAGMLLRSEWPGSHIADPHGALSLDRYEAEQGQRLARRLPLEDFVAYGLWYQEKVAPDVERRHVTCIEPDPAGGFRLGFEAGEPVRAGRVVMATGLENFEARPPAFAGAPARLATHSAEVSEPRSFSGLTVAVVGAGQCALELAALLHEAGAEVEVLARGPVVRWLTGRGWLRRYAGPLRKVIYPPGEVGPPGINWIVELPDLLRTLPPTMRRRVARRAIRPAGGAWVRPRLAGVPITTGRTVVTTEPAGSRLRLVLDDGSRREVDRAVLATGFRVDVGRSRVLAPELVRRLQTLDGAPLLGRGFEASVPGLHFVGAAAAESFGPLMRFVAGTGYAARSLAQHVARTA